MSSSLSLETRSTKDHKQWVTELLKSMETGDTAPLAHVNHEKYIQHNLMLRDGFQPLAEHRKSLKPGMFKVNIVRIFQDGDFVFTHNEFTAPTALIGFDVYRFENDLVVEHWDNFQDKPAKPNPSGHTMIDGPTVASDLNKTDANKNLISAFMEDLVSERREKFQGYFEDGNYVQHNPNVADNLSGLFAGLEQLAKQGQTVKITKVHRILGEGNFVLVVSEGTFGDQPSAYYDLYRIQNGKIAEHWDTIQPIPPRDKWNNSNGKF